MTVYVGADEDRGYVRFGERSPHLVVDRDGNVEQQAGEVLGLLRKQRLSKRLRAAVAQALDVEVDDVGRAAS